MFNNLSTRSKTKILNDDIEDDENDIDMSAILHPKLSSTRIERPRRAQVPLPPPKVTTDYYNKVSDNVPTQSIKPTNSPNGERQHSDIIEKVLAGIPLSNSEIRRVIHRRK